MNEWINERAKERRDEWIPAPQPTLYWELLQLEHAIYNSKTFIQINFPKILHFTVYFTPTNTPFTCAYSGWHERCRRPCTTQQNAPHQTYLCGRILGGCSAKSTAYCAFCMTCDCHCGLNKALKHWKHPSEHPLVEGFGRKIRRTKLTSAEDYWQGEIPSIGSTLYDCSCSLSRALKYLKQPSVSRHITHGKTLDLGTLIQCCVILWPNPKTPPRPRAPQNLCFHLFLNGFDSF